MSELTDDQLDGLFRKSSEEFEPPFDQAAWSQMKNLLDTAEETRPAAVNWKKMLRWGIPLLLLLLLTGTVWYVYSHKASPSPAIADDGLATKTVEVPVAKPVLEVATPKNVATKRKTSTANTDEQRAVAGQRVARETAPARTSVKAVEPSGEKITSVDHAVAGSLPANETRTDKREVVTRRSRPTLVAPGQRGTTNNPVLQTNRLLTKSGKARSRVVNPVPPDQKGALLQSGTAGTTKLDQPGSFEVTGLAVRRSVKSAGTMPVLSTEQVVPAEPAASAQDIAVSLLKSRAMILTKGKFPIDRLVESEPVSDYEPIKPVVQVVSAERGLSIRMAVAPDLSSVGLKNFSRPGTNIGVYAEYRLASRWSVQAGVIQSTKVYRAQTSDYDFPYKWPVNPESITGRCNMLDIPVNVRYDVVLRPRPDGRFNRWFISAGLTSYIMKNEDYDLNYADPTDPQIKYWGWHGSTGTYGLSQLNISAGYERAFSRRMSWQVEPFIKAPLRNIGFYKIDLLSSGVFFSIRYKL